MSSKEAERSLRVFEAISEPRLVALAREMIRRPSAMFQEGDVADFLADYLDRIGFEVEMIEVAHPIDKTMRTRQPIARLRGTGGGSTLMLNGHMDTNVVMPGWTVDPYQGRYEDGWLWGLGAQDDKGAIASAIIAMEAVLQSGIKLSGDVMLCAVAAHKLGGTGTRALLERGIRADYCINLEHSANTIGTTITGSLRVNLMTTSPGLFFRFTPEARSKYFNPIEQQAELIRRFGASLDSEWPKRWLNFIPHPELPGFPMIRYDSMNKDHYGRECSLGFQIRTIPGMTLDGMRHDVEAVLEAARVDFPQMQIEAKIPAGGENDPYFVEPVDLTRDHPLVEALEEGHMLASGQLPEIGGVERIGNFGDGNILTAAGIPSVQYGPGNVKNYSEWPAPDERVLVEELMQASRAVAHAALKLCA